MTVKIAPELVRDQTAAGGTIQPSLGRQVQKNWLPSNFKVAIGGIDPTSTGSVSKVDAIVFKQAVVTDQTGQLRDYADDAAYQAPVSFGIELPQSKSQPFVSWLAGSSANPADPSNARVGTVVYLAPDLQSRLFTVTLTGLRITKITPQAMRAGADTANRVRIELTAAGLQFDYGDVSWT